MNLYQSKIVSGSVVFNCYAWIRGKFYRILSLEVRAYPPGDLHGVEPLCAQPAVQQPYKHRLVLMQIKMKIFFCHT